MRCRSAARRCGVILEVGLRTDSAIVQPPFSNFNDWTFNDGIKANNLGVVNFFHILRALERILFSLLQEANYLVAATQLGNDELFARHSIRLWTAHYEKRRCRRRRRY